MSKVCSLAWGTCAYQISGNYSTELDAVDLALLAVSKRYQLRGQARAVYICVVQFAHDEGRSRKSAVRDCGERKALGVTLMWRGKER